MTEQALTRDDYEDLAVVAPLDAWIASIRARSVRSDTLASGVVVGGRYKIVSLIGEGETGFTYKATDPDGKVTALKECFPRAHCFRSGNDVELNSAASAPDVIAMMEQFTVEAEVLESLSHPNIVGGGEQLRENGTVYIAMDHVRGRSLRQMKRSFFWSRHTRRCQQMAEQLLSALEHIHAQGYLHNDISPDNILIGRDNRPVIIDFGNCTARTDEAFQPDTDGLVIIQPGYSPPEFYLEEVMTSVGSDIYALGATLYFMAAKEHPPEAMERMAQTTRQQRDPLMPIPRRGKADWVSFVEGIERALALLPDQRFDTVAQWKALIDG